MRTAPSSGDRMPASMRRNVDLPAPFEPINPYTEPSRTSAHTWSTAVMLPKRLK